MEGRINFTANPDTAGKKPHFKGFITINDEVHEFAVWPAKTGNGWSGIYKPKGAKQAPPTQEQVKEAYAKAPNLNLNDEIPF